MIAQRDYETRKDYLFRVAQAYISQDPFNAIDYDEATCDGECLATEMLVEFNRKEEVGLPEDFRRIALLFTSRCTRTKMTAGEKRAWVSATVKEHDLELLEWFYGLDKSPEFDCTWRRVGMPATLLNNLDAQLDLAFEHKEALRKGQPKLGTAPQWD